LGGDGAPRHGSVLAVVGAGHLKGITAALVRAGAAVVSTGDEALVDGASDEGEPADTGRAQVTADHDSAAAAPADRAAPTPGPASTREARDALRAHPDARALYVTHSETSTGALSDVKAIAQLTRETPTLLAVDSITGVGVHPVKMDEWGLDIVVSGSQKGCMMAPGLAFIAVSPRTWDAVKACQSPRYYLDLTAARRNWEKLGTAFTAPVSLVHALRRALEMIFDEGLDQVFERHARLARAARAAVQALGLRLLAERPANGVTAAYVPDGMSSSRLIALMRDKHGVTMADGQGDLKGRIIRIGHMGYVSEGDLLVGLAALEAGLREMGHAIELGGGLRAAQEALA